MKKILCILLVLVTVICIVAGCGSGNSVTGVWKCELYSSEQIIEFTSDGRFIDYVSGDENRYKIKGGNIVVYVEGVPESELEIAYEIKDDKLIFGKTEYVRANFSEHITASGMDEPEYD